MNFAQQNRNPARHLTAIGGVVLLHLIGGYILANGLGHRDVEAQEKPVDTTIVKVVSIVEPPPPEPPPPPPPEPPPPPPPPKAPPPPPKKAKLPVPPKVVKKVAPRPKAPVAVVTQKAPPPVVQAPPAPPRPVSVGAVCPNQRAVRSGVRYPPQAERQGLSGDVLVEFTLGAAGGIGSVQVVKSTNPIFNSTAINAVSKLKCVGQGQPVRVRVPFTFKVES